MTTITISLDTEEDIDEEVFVQNAVKITQGIIGSEILAQSSIAEEDFVNNGVSIDIMLCDNDTIHTINRDYRAKDVPTDVITFALFADSEPEMRVVTDGEIPLGEIIISLERIKTQAQEFNRTFEEELYFILAHGILHLFGFTHESEEKLESMIQLQQRLVEDVKI